MRATEIIRAVLDIIDSSEDHKPTGSVEISTDIHPSEPGEPVASRFRQIFAMLDNPNKGPLANSPNEVITDIESVTTDAGGGVNGPKHPDDVRIKDPRGFE